MIKKKKINFGTLEAFQQKKISSSARNTEYTIGIDNGEKMRYIGEPDIMWQTICFIKDVQKIWTGGQIYNCSEIDLSKYYTKEELDKLLESSLLIDVKTDHSTGKYIVAEDNDALGFARAADVAVQMLNNKEVVAASLNDLNERIGDIEAALNEIIG